MSVRIDYVSGQRFEGTRLTYLHDAPSNTKHRRAIFLCDCNRTTEVIIDCVKSLNTISCGCYNSEVAAERGSKMFKELLTTHGFASKGNKHWLYDRWKCMKQRCYDSNSKDYVNYGAKGIVVCRRWLYFTEFIKWIEAQGMTAASPAFEIHREDSSKNYGPNNCVCLPSAEHRKLEGLRKRLVKCL